MLLEIILWIFVAFTGLVIGSFLNVCIYRIPKKIFFKENRSNCPNCHTTLHWFELIPVFSFILLWGKCRTCKKPISFRYPLIEALNCFIYLFVYRVYGLSIYTLIYMILVSSLIVLSMIDIDTLEIPDGMHILIAGLGVISIILSFFTDTGILWWEHLIGAVAVSGLLYIIFLVTGGGIGGGDIKLMAAAGLLLGYKLIILAAIIGVVIGGLIGVSLMVIKKKKGKAQMPLGPSLSFGIVISVLFGNFIINSYLSLL